MHALLQQRKKLETELERIVGQGEHCQIPAEGLAVLSELEKVARQIREVQREIDRRSKNLGELLTAVLVEMRCLIWAGATTQAGDLAEAAREVARDLADDKDFSWEILCDIFEKYQRQYHGESYVGKRDYLKMVEEIRRVA